MAWSVLIVAGLLEIVWALLLKESDGFSKLWPSLGFFVAGTGSIVLLALAPRWERHTPPGQGLAQ